MIRLVINGLIVVECFTIIIIALHSWYLKKMTRQHRLSSDY